MADQAWRSCNPGRSACIRRWSSSLIMKHSVSSRFRTSPLPALLAACSRLIKCRSTRICLSSADKLSIVSEEASFISGNPSMAGRISSRMRTRSGFLAQPGKDASLIFRARRTRLDMTIRSCGPLRRAVSAGGIRKEWISMLGSGRSQPRRSLLDLVPEYSRLFEILRLDRLGQSFMKRFEPVGQITVLPKSFRHFANMPSPFVHGLNQPLEWLGKSLVAFRASESAGLFEICLGEPAPSALELGAAGRLLDFLRGTQPQQQVG